MTKIKSQQMLAFNFISTIPNSSSNLVPQTGCCCFSHLPRAARSCADRFFNDFRSNLFSYSLAHQRQNQRVYERNSCSCRHGYAYHAVIFNKILFRQGEQLSICWMVNHLIINNLFCGEWTVFVYIMAKIGHASMTAND